MRTDAKNSGFTLLELLAALAVASILVGLGAPALSGLAGRLKTVSATSELTAGLADARLSAVAKNRPVTMCPSVDGIRCTGGIDWSHGWIVYVDPGRAAQPASADDVVRTSGALSPGLRAWSSAGRNRIRFQPSGWASGSNLTIQLCHARGAGRRIIVNNAGRVRSDADSGACRPT